MFSGAKSLRISANKTVVWDPNWIMKLLPYWLVLIEPNGLPSLLPILQNIQCTFYSVLSFKLVNFALFLRWL